MQFDFRSTHLALRTTSSDLFRPPTTKSFLALLVSFGFDYNDDPADGWVQGGINDQGLCIEGNGLPTVSLNPHPEREDLYLDPVREVLFECSTVNDSIEWFETHYCGTVWGCQIHIADATGDANVTPSVMQVLATD